MPTARQAMRTKPPATIVTSAPACWRQTRRRRRSADQERHQAGAEQLGLPHQRGEVAEQAEGEGDEEPPLLGRVGGVGQGDGDDQPGRHHRFREPFEPRPAVVVASRPPAVPVGGGDERDHDGERPGHERTLQGVAGTIPTKVIGNSVKGDQKYVPSKRSRSQHS